MTIDEVMASELWPDCPNGVEEFHDPECPEGIVFLFRAKGSVATLVYNATSRDFCSLWLCRRSGYDEYLVALRKGAQDGARATN
jgi:hypothetical protein